jgi:hypothetical protein
MLQRDHYTVERVTAGSLHAPWASLDLHLEGLNKFPKAFGQPNRYIHSICRILNFFEGQRCEAIACAAVELVHVLDLRKLKESGNRERTHSAKSLCPVPQQPDATGSWHVQILYAHLRQITLRA